MRPQWSKHQRRPCDWSLLGNHCTEGACRAADSRNLCCSVAIRHDCGLDYKHVLSSGDAAAPADVCLTRRSQT